MCAPRCGQYSRKWSIVTVDDDRASGMKLNYQNIFTTGCTTTHMTALHHHNPENRLIVSPKWLSTKASFVGMIHRYGVSNQDQVERPKWCEATVRIDPRRKHGHGTSETRLAGRIKIRHDTVSFFALSVSPKMTVDYKVPSEVPQ